MHHFLNLDDSLRINEKHGGGKTYNANIVISGNFVLNAKLSSWWYVFHSLVSLDVREHSFVPLIHGLHSE